MPLESFSLDRATLTDVSPLLCDEHGVLKVVDASVLSATSLEDRVAFCVASGSYLLPTTELVAALKAAIGGRTALEIGSGSGVLAKALGIRATDNRMQEWPEVKKLYGSLQQAVVSYGENVEEIDAEEAVLKYKPQVVIAAWVTHKYDPARPHAGGNEHGVIEENIIDNCETYIFVGNSKVHANKSIWERPHTRIEPPWLYSRAINGSPNFIAAWGAHQCRIIQNMRDIYETLSKTLDKTFLTNFRAFIALHQDETEFVIASDYCIKDKGKFNDVIAFTIAPKHVVSSQTLWELGRTNPRDIKDTREISDEILSTLRDKRFFHVAFMLDDIYGFLYAEGLSKREVMLRNIDQIWEMLRMWSENQPDGRAKFQAQMKVLESVKRRLERKNAKIDIFHRMSFTSILAAIVAFYISREIDCKRIDWFVDRDEIHSSYDRIYFDFFEMNHWGLCLQEIPESRIPRVGGALGQMTKEKPWYDPFVRFPDFFAGTLASMDRETGAAKKRKHNVLIEEIFANNPQYNIIRVEMSRDNWRFSFRSIEKSEGPQVSMSRAKNVFE